MPEVLVRNDDDGRRELRIQLADAALTRAFKAVNFDGGATLSREEDNGVYFWYCTV
jgi:hypothetical protein